MNLILPRTTSFLNNNPILLSLFLCLRSQTPQGSSVNVQLKISADLLLTMKKSSHLEKSYTMFESNGCPHFASKSMETLVTFVFALLEQALIFQRSYPVPGIGGRDIRCCFDFPTLQVIRTSFPSASKIIRKSRFCTMSVRQTPSYLNIP